jgi:protocatechuate 3,4-dioxygenase beta subunit
VTSETLGPRDWGAHPPYVYPQYTSTVLRGPKRPLVPLKHTLSELTGPVFGHESLGPLDHDLTRNGARNGEPLGERIVVTGRVLDEAGQPVRHTLIEIWQANAAGRYIHRTDQHDAPLDPNFIGGGRCVTDEAGAYQFYTVKPGAYPWANHDNAWRPNHIHLSLRPGW